MTTTIIPRQATFRSALSGLNISKAARKILFKMLARLKYGRLTITENGQERTFGSITDKFSVAASIKVHNPNFYSSTVFGGSIGSAEAYMAGYWTCDDLTAAVRIIIRNQAVFEGMDKGWSRLTSPLNNLFHLMRRNTLKGSQENIMAHYDLSNDFYRLFLDETMTYSSGIFETPASTLKDASLAKYDRICKKLVLKPEDHVLEIGTGWGGFALHAAQNYGCRVTTITISKEQHDDAMKRIQASGLGNRIELKLMDYREVTGLYDKIVSIEMIEAVGHQYLNTFFSQCSRRLKPEGMMLLQSITMADHVFEAHKHSVDFIKRYIFPGSCIPSLTAMSAAAAKSTDLRLVHLEDITPHYATTLKFWRDRFFASIDKVRALGFSNTFIRMWEFYLCYCEAGFRERYIGDVQVLWAKPLCRTDPILPNL